MNWAMDNSGAYELCSRYSGFHLCRHCWRYHDKNYVIRFAEALMPKVANTGIHLECGHVSRARRKTSKLELHGKVLKNRPAGAFSASAQLRESRQHGATIAMP